ncbi:hypothetical protein C8R43DRAFT_1001576 [Mycena crocata]|nr:hypothetical protein C8R43DRAFT_1001576 [Mycena crocata]
MTMSFRMPTVLSGVSRLLMATARTRSTHACMGAIICWCRSTVLRRRSETIDPVRKRHAASVSDRGKQLCADERLCSSIKTGRPLLSCVQASGTCYEQGNVEPKIQAPWRGCAKTTPIGIGGVRKTSGSDPASPVARESASETLLAVVAVAHIPVPNLGPSSTVSRALVSADICTTDRRLASGSMAALVSRAASSCGRKAATSTVTPRDTSCVSPPSGTLGSGRRDPF